MLETMSSITPNTFFPSLDPASYAWKQLPQASSLWERKALSNEAMWFPRPKELRELFVYASMTFTSSVTRTSLECATRDAWRTLRFGVPELGARAVCGEDSNMYFQYQIPKSATEVESWIARTATLRIGNTSHDFHELRKSLLQTKAGRDADNAFILIHCQAEEDRSDQIKHVQLVLNVDHQITDGNGIKILLGRYLELLAAALIQPSAEKREIIWHDSCKNLSTPWIQLVNDEQVIFGSELEEAAAFNRDIMMNKLVPIP